MNTEETKRLLDKYYAGETSEIEEISLMAYFAQPNVPDELEPDRRYFAQLYNVAGDDGHKRIERRMGRAIDEWNFVEKGSLRKARTRLLRWTAAIAASALLIFAFGTTLTQKSNEQRLARQEAAFDMPKETYNDPDEAYKKAEMALVQFSRCMNKGLKGMEKKH